MCVTNDLDTLTNSTVLACEESEKEHGGDSNQFGGVPVVETDTMPILGWNELS